MHHMDVRHLCSGPRALAAALIAGLLLSASAGNAGAAAVKPLKIRPEALKLATVTEPVFTHAERERRHRSLYVHGGIRVTPRRPEPQPPVN
jgi:hypothetical protein